MRCALLGLLACAGTAAPGPSPPAAPATAAGLDPDAERALRDLAQTRNFARGAPTSITVAPDGARVWFLRSGPRDAAQALYAFDVATGETRERATGAGLLGGEAETLSEAERARRERLRIRAGGITRFALSRDGRRVLIPHSGRLFGIDGDAPPRALADVQDADDPRLSPDGEQVAFVRDHDLHVADWRSGAVRRVTHGGTAAVRHGVAEFVAQEEMGRDAGYWWSPDGARLAYTETDARGVETLHIADPAAPERPPEAFFYPRAGRANVVVRLGVVPAAGGATTWIEWDRERHPYLAAVTWDEHGPLALLVQSRAQQDQVLLAADPQSGRTRELLREHDDAWLNLFADQPRWLPGGRFLWIGEADGETRLSLHEPDGTRARVLNPGDGFRLREVLHVDEPGGRVIVTGSARPPEQHVFSLALAGDRPPERLTEAAGVHTRWYGRGGAHVARHARLDGLGSFAVHRADGTAAGTLPSLAEAPPPPRVELTEVAAADGRTALDAAIVRPRGFDPRARYPVIVQVYGGPGGGVVHHDLRAYLRAAWLAERGFVVVLADNRGVAHRGRAFERALRGTLVDVPLADQVAALRGLCARYRELDCARVGIVGWSFGGTMAAMAVARHGNVFAAGVAGAPVTDWQDYDTHYTERYLGLPQQDPEAYRRASPLAAAPGQARPLLILHGTADDNVYFSHALKLADALLAAGRPFELAPLAGVTHVVRDPDRLVAIERRTVAFLRGHLGAPRR